VLGCVGQFWEVLEKKDVEVQTASFSEVMARGEHGDRADGQGGVVERKNAEDAAGVEVAEAMSGVGIVDGVPEDAGDQKGGEHEEEFDADPSRGGKLAEETADEVGGLESAAVMEEVDEQDGDAAQTVQGQVMAAVGGRLVERLCAGHCGQAY